MTYGYARCSTDETRQDIDRQRRELRKLGVEADTEIYWEYESGTKTERPELQKLLAVLQTGDTIVTTEVSRLTRIINVLAGAINVYWALLFYRCEKN